MTAAAPSTSQQRSMHKRRSVRRPTLGVFLNKRPMDIDPRGFQDCLNVRIRDGKVYSDAMGWENFPQFASDSDRINLDGLRVLHIDEYRSRSDATTAIFCNAKDIFRFNASAGPPATVTYMTPIYNTGTAAVISGPTTTVTGSGTLWDTAKDTDPVTAGYGNNVKAGDYISFGANDEYAQDAVWHEIASVTSDTELELVASTATVADGQYTIRQCLSGGNDDLFAATTFQDAQGVSPVGSDMYYMTNGVEMVGWNGLTDTMEWFYPGFVGKGVITHKQTLSFWNLLEGGQRLPGQIAYSQLAYPENFTTNGAGRVQPADGVLDLQRVLPIGDQLACYFEGDIVIMQYVDAPLYFIARVAVPGVGLIAPRAMMDFGDYHEFLGIDAAYRFDGVTIIESMNQVFREVLRKQAPNVINLAYAYMDEENAEVIWSVPLATDGDDPDTAIPSMGYVEFYIEDNGQNLPAPMTIRDFPFTAIGYYATANSLRFSDFPATAFTDTALQWDDRALSTAFPLQIVGDDNGDIWILNTTNARNGVGYESYVVFPRFPVVDGERKGLVERIEPFTTRRQGATDYALDVAVRFFEFADGDVMKTALQEFDMTHQGLRYVPVRQSGRFAEVKFSTDSGVDDAVVVPAQPWDVSGYGVRVSPVGDR